MDSPAIDPMTLWRAYEQFERMNALVANWHRVYVQQIRPALIGLDRPVRLLDIGFGGGDIPMQLLSWAREDGIELRITAIDRDPRALNFVRRVRPQLPIKWLQTDSADLVAAGERYDVVVSNHVIHHLQDTELTRLLAHSDQLASRLAIHVDIERGALPFLGLALLGPLLFHGSLIVWDGLISIRRSFSRDELQALAGPDWSVSRMFFARLVLSRDYSG